MTENHGGLSTMLNFPGCFFIRKATSSRAMRRGGLLIQGANVSIPLRKGNASFIGG